MDTWLGEVAPVVRDSLLGDSWSIMEENGGCEGNRSPPLTLLTIIVGAVEGTRYTTISHTSLVLRNWPMRP